MEKILRSRILEYFPFDLRVDLELLSRRRDISNAEKQDEIINLLRKYNVGNVVKLGSGTNRYAFKIGGYVVKVATDQDGRIDNMKEFRMAPKLYPYVTRIYEISENGTLLVAEYIQPFTAFGEMMNYSDKIRKILRELSSQYLIGDVGISAKNYGNWGLRVGYDEPVCLDFAYVYEVNSGLFLCSNCNSGAILVPNNDFTKLVCPNPNCQKVVNFEDIRRKIGNNVHRQEIGDLTDAGYLMTQAQDKVILDPSKSLYLKSEKEETREDNVQTTETIEEEDFSMNVYEISKRMLAHRQSMQDHHIKEVDILSASEDKPKSRNISFVPMDDVVTLDNDHDFAGYIDSGKNPGIKLPGLVTLDNPNVFDLELSEGDDEDINGVIAVDNEADKIATLEVETSKVSDIKDTNIPVKEVEIEAVPQKQEKHSDHRRKVGYSLSHNCRKYLYRNVSELSKRMVAYLDNQGVLQDLKGHYDSKLTDARFSRILQTAIFKALAAYMHFTEERVMNNGKEITMFNPPEDITNPEYFDTIVFIDQYWRYSDIRRHEGDPTETLSMYDKHYPSTGVLGINHNWLRYLEDSMKTNMFSTDKEGRRLIRDALDGTWVKDPVGTIMPEHYVDEDDAEDAPANVTDITNEVAVSEPETAPEIEVQEVPAVVESHPEKDVSNDASIQTEPNKDIAITIEEPDTAADSVMDTIAKTIDDVYQEVMNADEADIDMEDEECDEDEESEEEMPVPIQIFIIEDGDYKVAKIVYEDESGDVTIPIYEDLDDDSKFPGLDDIDPFGWLKMFCPERTFSTEDSDAWLELNKINLPCNNLRFAIITPDRNEYLMGYYFYAGVYRISGDGDSEKVEDDIPYLKKIAWLADHGAIPTYLSHTRINVNNDEFYCDTDEVEDLCRAFYNAFDIEHEFNINENRDSTIIDDDVPQTPYGIQDIEASEEEMKMNPYLAPIQALNEQTPDHSDILPVFTKEIDTVERMFENDH